jgi:hypothetical protein
MRRYYVTSWKDYWRYNREFGRRILRDGEKIVSEWADAFGTSVRAIYYYKNKFYDLYYEIGAGGPYNFVIDKVSREEVEELLSRWGYEDEEIEEMLKDYE